MNTKMFRLTILVAVAAGLLAGCGSPTPTLAPTVDTQPTLDAVSTIAVQTVYAQLTENAPTATPVIPTDTPAPTAAPTETLVPSPTVVLPTATATVFHPTWTFVPTPATATPVPATCSITTQEPATGAVFAPKADFDGHWVVKNISKETWQASNTDVRFVSGDKFQVGGDLYDIAADVAVDGSTTITIDMVAPTTVGKYKATWGVYNGSTLVCSLNVNIEVK
jgi:hypothetical protein